MLGPLSAATTAGIQGMSLAQLPEDLQLTPEQFAALCQANPNAVLELDARPGRPRVNEALPGAHDACCSSSNG